MDLIDKENSRNKFSYALVNVSIDNFIYLRSEFFSDFCFLWFHDLTHQAHEIISSLRLGISHI